MRQFQNSNILSEISFLKYLSTNTFFNLKRIFALYPNHIAFSKAEKNEAEIQKQANTWCFDTFLCVFQYKYPEHVLKRLRVLSFKWSAGLRRSRRAHLKYCFMFLVIC